MNICTTCGHGLHDARATWTTCQACQDRITGQLAAIEQLWAVLPNHLEPTRGHSGPRVSGTAAASLPAAEAVLDLIGPGGVPTQLYLRYADITLARGLVPQRRAFGSDALFAQAVRGIRRHLPWAVQGTSLAELSRELGTMLGKLQAVTGGTAPAPAVPCPADLDGARCTGLLRYDRDRSTAACRTCRTELDPSQWLEYWVQLGQPAA
ncbi:hypothetical protein PV378_13635 [Streptomyces scabiei]|uniref:hypothetical protein n=1 Tax=Streptomyces scabiei TaxID=1930 RepID=UPI0029A1BFAC|nr:hypothetical protein [Streptomyces scabiei]MDX3047535.1 hypothetical protein [Streptomyces scabiei]